MAKIFEEWKKKWIKNFGNHYYDETGKFWLNNVEASCTNDCKTMSRFLRPNKIAASIKVKWNFNGVKESSWEGVLNNTLKRIKY